MNTQTPARRPNSRLKWLRSASVLAAASAMIAGGSTAYAQARPGIGAVSGVPVQDGRGQVLAPRELPGEFNATMPNVRAPRPAQGSVSQPRNNTVAAPVDQQVSISRAPNFPSIPVVDVKPTPEFTGSLTGSATPQDIVMVDGIAVRARAEFDNNLVNFTPNPDQDIVNVVASSAIIDWTTFDPGTTGGQVTFLGAGDSLVFTSDSSSYTVLNRIRTPGVDAAVRIDGSIIGLVNGGTAFGGNIWFSTPGGLIIGNGTTHAAASFLFTTSTIDPSSVNNGPLDVRFTGVSNPNSAVVFEQNSTILAGGGGQSYVAVVAPRIEQRGTVTVNGSVAYVAAEEARMTIQNGLFDIAVTVGSDEQGRNGIVHTGETGGPASVSATDGQGIYFVAVPKNNALTMLLSGDVGYSPAASAAVENGQIILTTGNRVERTDSIDPTTGASFSTNTVDTTVDGGLAGNILLEDLTLTSNTIAFAEDTVTLQAGVTNPLDQINVGSLTDPVNLEVIGGRAVNVTVDGEGLIDASRNLILRSGDGMGTGGSINLDLSQNSVDPNGGLNVGNILRLDVSARGGDEAGGFANNGGTGIGGDGVAGDVAISITGGADLTVGGFTFIDASANGGRGDVRDGSATGGTVDFTLTEGSVNLLNTFVIDVAANDSGTETPNFSTIGPVGSSSTAGNVTINLAGGTGNFSGIDIDASAIASSGSDETVAQSNDAFGGSVAINVTSGSHSMQFLDVFADAEAEDGFDATGTLTAGLAGRGTFDLAMTGVGTALFIDNDITVFASTLGEVAPSTAPTINIRVVGTGLTDGTGLSVGGGITISTSASNGGRGVLTQAGGVSILADNGLIEADGLSIGANAFFDPFTSLTAEVGTDYQGATVDIVATNQGSISVNGFGFISAEGTGAVNANDPGAGIGQGGTVNILADSGSIRFTGSLFIDADGFAFPGTNSLGDIGEGIGGMVSITVQGADGSLEFSNLDTSTNGSTAVDSEVVTEFFVGDGSVGRGGTTQFNVLGGTLTANNLTVRANGQGGPGGLISDGTIDPATGGLVTGDGGTGIGGTVIFNLDGGTANLNSLDIQANGLGGSGASGSDIDGTNSGNGGDAVGGSATFNAISGTLNVASTLTVQATGNRDTGFGISGGRGGSGSATRGGDGGNSTGGEAVFNLDGTAIITAADVIISTQGFGGEGGDSFFDFLGSPDAGGGDGGDGTGGTAIFNDIAGDLSFGTLTVNASGVGANGGDSRGDTTGDSRGPGGNAGNGTGGTALISLNQDDTDPKSYSVLAQGIGGQGGFGISAGLGGVGIGGFAQLAVNNVSVVFEQLSIDAGAVGGQGGFIDGQQANDGADGGDAEGGTAQLLVSGPNADFQANSRVSISAGATGGQGGNGSSTATAGVPNGNGGQGGNALGGSALVSVADNALITISADDFAVNADSFGGTGGAGAGGFNGAAAGNGGAGGDATGGTVGITAESGGNVTIVTSSGPFQLSSVGTGGAGGFGGNTFATTGMGAGGDGGVGTGGSPLLRATGGTINISDVELVAQGQGADGGAGGISTSGVAAISGPQGAGGGGNGGSPIIEVLEGSPGILNLGNVDIFANGTGGTGSIDGLGSGGQVLIRDASTDPLGNITMGDLFIDATGDLATSAGRIDITSESGPITVNGNFVAGVVGNLTFSMIGDGQLVVTGGTTVIATDIIAVRHINQTAGVNTIDIGTSFTANVISGNFIALNGGDIVTNAAVVITAENISYNNITTSSTVDLNATTGSITGNSTGTITASNGADAIDLIAAQDVTVGNLVTTNGNIDIDAGNNINVLGSTLAAGRFAANAGGDFDAIAGTTIDAGSEIEITANNISFDTLIAGADDVFDADEAAVEINAVNGSITARPSGSIRTPSGIDLDATQAITVGDLAIIDGPITIDAGTTLTTGNISIQQGGLPSNESIQINAGGDTVLGDVAAIDGLTINSGGSLTAGALRGTVINAAAAGAVNIASATTFAGIAGGAGLTISGASIFLGEADIRTLAGTIDLTATSGGITTGTMAANGDVSITAATGVDIGSLTVTGAFNPTTITAQTITAGPLDLSSALIANATAGSVILSGVSSVGSADLDATDDIIFESLETANGFDANAGGNITGGSSGRVGFDAVGAQDKNFTAGGDITLTGTIESFDEINITAGGAVDVGDLAALGNINVTAATTATIRSLATQQAFQDASVTAQSITIGSFDLVDALTVNATAGNIDILADSSATGTTTLTATGDINFASIANGNRLTVDAGGNITGGSATRFGFDAVGVQDKNFTAGGDITLTGTVESFDLINLTSGGAINAANLTAINSITVDAGTVANITSISTTGAFAEANITGQSVIIGDAAIADEIFAIATAGDVTINGTVTALRINAQSTGGGLTIAGLLDSRLSNNLSADGGDLLITGTVDAATSNNLSTTNGDILIQGSLIASDSNNLTATGGSIIATADVTSGQASTWTADIDIDFASISIANGNLRLTAGRDILGTTVLHTAPDGSGGLDRIFLDAGRNIAITGLVQTLDDGIFVSAIGDVSISQLSGSATNEVIAGGAIDIGTLTSMEAFDATLTGSSVNIDNGSISTNLIVTSTSGDITGLGSITVGNTATFNSAGNIAIGTLEANNISLTAAGDLRFNGLISPNAITLSAINGTIGATTPGLGDIDSGGTVDLTALAIDMGDIISAGSITAEATGGDASFGDLNAGTFINITASGSPIAQSVTSVGDTTLTGASVTLNGGDIGGSLFVNATAGDITVGPDGSQQLLVGQAAVFNATGDMNVSHTNNTGGLASIDAGSNIFVGLGGTFTSAPGSILNSGTEIVIDADGGIDAADLRAVTFIDLTSENSITLANATATGPQGGANASGITIRAGATFLPGLGFLYNPGANATITGDVSSYRDIDITAGGNAVFAAGSTTAADNILVVNTGDDIIVEAGASLISGLNPFDPGIPADLILNAGGETNLLSTPITPFASIVMDGSLNSNSGSVILTANAIDGRNSTISGNNVFADILNAPPSGSTLGDDDGLLSGPCLQGIVCLGEMQVVNQIAIGQASPNDVIRLFIEQANVEAREIRITTREDIVMGTNGINTVLNATDLFSATSLTGDVDLRDVSISSATIQVVAAGSVIGTGSLTSGNDIFVSVGDSVILGAVITDGILFNEFDVNGIPLAPYSVPGDFSVGFFSQGGGDIDVNAGGSINIGEAVSPDSIFLTAGGDAFLGLADIPGDINIAALGIGYDVLSAGGDVLLFADAGVTGGDITGSSDVDISGTSVDIGNIDASNTVTISAGSIAVGNVIANDIDLLSDTDILFNLLQSANAITLSATNGIIASNGGAGDIVSDGDVTLDALEIAINDVTSTGSVSANATAGDATFGVVDAANDITINASGTPSVLNAISGGNTSITGSSVTFNNGTIGGDLTLTATDGDIDGNGTVSVGGGIDFSATGNVGFGSLDAQGGSFVVDAGGDVTFVSATSTDFIDMTAGGAIAGGDLLATNAVTVDGGNIAVGDVIANQINLTSDTDILFNLIQSPSAISLTATGGVIGANTGPGDIVSDSDVSLLAQAIAINEVDAGGNVTASATAGGVTIANTLSGGTISISATGDINVDHAEADGDFIASGDGGITTGLNSIITGGDIIIDVIGIADLGNSSAGGLVDVAASQIDFVTVVAGQTITMLARDAAGATGAPGNGNITGVDLTAGAGASSITAEAGDIAVTGTLQFGGSLLVDASGDIALGPINTQAGGFTGIAGGSFTGSTITSGGSVDVTAIGGDLTAGDITAGGSISLSADNGAVSVGATDSLTSTTITGQTVNFSTVTAGTDVSITATSGALIGMGVFAGGSVSLTAGGGAITLDMLTASEADLIATDAVNIAEADVDGLLSAEGTAIDIASTGDLTVDVTATDGDASVSAQGVLTAQSAVASGDVTLTAGENLRVENATGANIALLAGENIQIAGLADAVNALSINAGGLFDAVDGSAFGETIDITSADVSLGNDSLIGDATRTVSVTFNFSGEGTLGGDGSAATPWVLDNSEFAQVFSGSDITVNALLDVNGGGGVLTVDTLDVIAGDGSSLSGQNIGQSGSLILRSDSIIDILGDLTITGATLDTVLSLEAVNRIRVDSANGGLFVLDANGGLGGLISISAEDFYALTDQAFADIDGLSVAEVDARLADSDGVDRPDGVIRADTLDIATTSSDVFIQNTVPGTDFADRRGFDVNVLTISSGGGTGSIQPIVINGVVEGVTGVDTIPLVDISSSPDPDSTINGCLIADPASCIVVITPPGGSDGSDGAGEAETRDLIEDGLTPPETRPEGTLQGGLINLNPNSAFAPDPLIDDPVTGAGNEDLWVSDEEECPEGEVCETEPAE